tara:strand:+ start:123 stop:980 length:858 start_codon:yes stop_codon:yes gene_type:complete
MSFFKTSYLFALVMFFNIQLYSQEGKYIPIENFIFRHQQFEVNQNGIVVSPVDRILNNRISFFIEQEFKGIVGSTKNIIWESYESKINSIFRSHKLTFSARVQLNKTNELRYLTVDYLPYTEEISTPYIWDNNSRTFVIKDDVNNIEKYKPNLQTLEIDNQEQKAKLDELIEEHKNLLDGISNNTIYFNKSKENELNRLYENISVFTESQFSNIDFVMNISWDSYDTFVSSYDTYHYHTFLVQVKVKNLNRNKFIEVYYNPLYDRITSDFKWNEKSKQYMRIASE